MTHKGYTCKLKTAIMCTTYLYASCRKLAEQKPLPATYGSDSWMKPATCRRKIQTLNRSPSVHHPLCSTNAPPLDSVPFLLPLPPFAVVTFFPFSCCCFTISNTALVWCPLGALPGSNACWEQGKIYMAHEACSMPPQAVVSQTHRL